MKFDNKYCRCSKAFFTMLTLFILLTVVVIPAVNARPPNPPGGNEAPITITKEKSGSNFGVLWWTGEGLGNAEADIKGLTEALNGKANSNLEFDYNNVYPCDKPWRRKLFLKEELGGYDIIDTAEFVYYVGHGAGGPRPNFENLNYQNSLLIRKTDIGWISVYPWECSWGEKVKVVALGCCFGTEGGFAESMDGVNLVKGTTAWMDDRVFGELLGPSLTHMTCKQAWFDTQIRMSVSNDLKARVLGENTTVGDDRIGDYTEDVEVDNKITYWTCPINCFEPLQYPSDSQSNGQCGSGNLDSATQQQNTILILTNNNLNQNVGSTESNSGVVFVTTGSNGNPLPAGTSGPEPIVSSGTVVSGTAVIGGSSKKMTGTDGVESPVGEPDTPVITAEKTATIVTIVSSQSEAAAVVKSLLNKINSVSRTPVIIESESVSKTPAISISNDVSSDSKSTSSISSINRVSGVRSVNPYVGKVEETNPSGLQAAELLEDEGSFELELNYNIDIDNMYKAFPTNRKSNVGFSSSYARLIAQDYYKKHIDSLDDDEIYSIKVVPQKQGYCYKARAKEEQAYKSWTIAYNVFIIKDLVNKKDIDDGGSSGGNGNIDSEESQSYSGNLLTGGGGSLRSVRGSQPVSKDGGTTSTESTEGNNIKSDSSYRKTTLIIGAGPTVCYEFSRITDKEHEDQSGSPCDGKYDDQDGNNGGNIGNLIGIIQQAMSLILNEGGLR